MAREPRSMTKMSLLPSRSAENTEQAEALCSCEPMVLVIGARV